ncbi:MAG: hypothetical protein ACRDKA_10795 [Actinomycetota bacterium]
MSLDDQVVQQVELSFGDPDLGCGTLQETDDETRGVVEAPTVGQIDSRDRISGNGQCALPSAEG